MDDRAANRSGEGVGKKGGKMRVDVGDIVRQNSRLSKVEVVWQEC